MKQIGLSLLFLVALNIFCFSQTGQEFWLAPPDITLRHNPSVGDSPIYLNLTSSGADAVVTIDQPANALWTPLTVTIPSNTAVRYDMAAYKDQLETIANNTIQNTGLHISSTTDITAYYENANPNNPDFMALKGNNGLGVEFFIPMHKHDAFYNHDFSGTWTTDWAYSSFDIVATEDGTTVLIYSPVDVLGHPALIPFTLNLNAGQTYSCANMDIDDYDDPTQHPSGAVVLADKPIAISIKDDSNHNPSGGCYDLMTDQIVPVDILGTDYIAIKGQLNDTGDESCFIMATQNNTQLYIDGSALPVATLFAGQSYRHDMDYLASSIDNSTYIYTSKPSYVTHVTGFGCEQGQAILPPLNCAGSRQLSFTRATSEAFYLNLMVRSGSENDFIVSGPGTAAIPGAAFQLVPGSGGEWMAAQIQYDLTQVPINEGFIVSNTSDVFSLAIINGGATTGCRYGFFSEFAGETITFAGVDQNLCEGELVTLAGAVTGGAVTGEWTTSGSGSFNPRPSDLAAIYEPSLGDYLSGSITLNLISTGECDPVEDEMEVTFQSLPLVSSGDNIDICFNDPIATLDGSVLNAVGGAWVGGLGTFSPDRSALDATYEPTISELQGGGVSLTLTSTGNGNCPMESDELIINILDAPIVSAGSDITVCASNLTVPLSGSVTGGSSSGQWVTTGSGTFFPNEDSVNGSYIASSQDSLNGTVILTLTSTNNGLCFEEQDEFLITFLSPGTADAGADITVCANSPLIELNGAINGNATSGIWSTSGSGTFAPNPSTLDATYSPSAIDIANGSLLFTLESNSCDTHSDDVQVEITLEPIVNAGVDLVTCVDDLMVDVNGSVSGITATGIWETLGSGTFLNGVTSLSNIYEASSADSLAGEVSLILNATNIGTCLEVRDTLIVSILPAAAVSAGDDMTFCANNAEAQLNGTLFGSPQNIQWTTSGSGTFDPSNEVLNPSYIPSVSDTAAGSVTLTLSASNSCNPAGDDLILTLTPAPFVNAGPDQIYCETATEFDLNGIVSGISTQGLWTTTGSGTIANPTSLATSYIASTEDLSLGQIDFFLISQFNDNCNQVVDMASIFISTGIEVDAGQDQQVCSLSGSAQLNPSITNGFPAGIWSTNGTGSFSPSNNTLNASYNFSQEDIDGVSILLTLTTTDNGTCAAESDELILTFGTSSFADAGEDISVCSNDPVADLSGTVSGGAIGALWSTSGTGTFDDIMDISTSYSLSEEDVSNGGVELTLTTVTDGTCTTTSDELSVSVESAPTINAGDDQVVCSADEVLLSASITNSNSVQWTSSGSGSFLDPTSSSTFYYLSELDSLLGSVTLTVVTVGNGVCEPAYDQLEITFGGDIQADAGLDISTCADGNDIALNGAVSDAGGGLWTTSGTGSFSPGPDALDAVYTPSSTDVLFSELVFVLTTTENSGCLAARDTMLVLYEPVAIVDAGADQAVCDSEQDIQLSGSVSNAQTAYWTTNGNGVFIPNEFDLDAIYQPELSDEALGSITITLIASGESICSDGQDDMELSFINSLSLDFSTENNCAGQEVIFTDISVIPSGNIIAWNWDFGNGEQGAGQTSTTEYETAGQYIVELEVIASDGCSAQMSQTIEISPTPIAGFSVGGSMLENSALSFIDSSFDASDYQYDFGDGAESLESDPTHIFSSPGEYLVTQTVSSSAGCFDVASMLLSIFSEDVLAPKLPNAFSPNGDGENDVFYVRGGPFTTIHMEIYNGWGELIFLSDDPLFGWDGNVNGKPEQIGGYVYTAVATTADGREFVKSGKVALIR